jgi:Sec-independent protein translocase protein TatA
MTSFVVFAAFFGCLLSVNAFVPRRLVSRGSLGRIEGNGDVSRRQDGIVNTQIGRSAALDVRNAKPLRDILGLGPAEIAITLVVGLVLFGPETLKSLSKDVGKAAAELKEIPKTFKEGMEEGAESSQVAKMKAIAAEKKKKRDAKKAKKEDEEDDEDEDDDEEDDDGKNDEEDD